MRASLIWRCTFTTACILIMLLWHSAQGLSDKNSTSDSLSSTSPSSTSPSQSTASSTASPSTLHDRRDIEPIAAADIGSTTGSSEEAAVAFHRRITELRVQQRLQLERVATAMLTELQSQQDQWLRSGRETKTSLAAWRSVANTWQTASDLPTAITLALQLRSQLSVAHQKRLLELVDQFASQVAEYRQARQQYQRYLVSSMQRQWPTLTLAQKRFRLRAFYFLEDQRPEWLSVHRPAMATLPLDRSVKDALRTFDSKRDSFRARVEMELGKHVESLLSTLRPLLANSKSDQRQATCVQELIQLLESDYGHGLRGLMLCEIDSAMPDEASVATEQMLIKYQRLLSDWRAQHSELLIELKLRLEPLRENLLAEQKLGELLAIDIAIAESSNFLKPLRIFATRNAGSTAPEDCLLHDKGERGFEVEFLRDARRCWLPRSQVHLKPSPIAPPYPIARPPEPLQSNKPFDLLGASGNYVCYTPGGWQPCQILDVSPFGVVVQFEDLLEPVYPLVSRDCVR